LASVKVSGMDWEYMCSAFQ